MKTIGLLGGMSWESTMLYYRLINEGVKARLGGLHSARILLHSVDFHDIEACQAAGEWDKAAAILTHAAQGLQRAGAEGILLCTNTMHNVAPAIASGCHLPFIHIADATGSAIVQQGLTRVALLGTRYTMEQDFYRARLRLHALKLTVLSLTSCVRAPSAIAPEAITSRLWQGWLSRGRRALSLAVLRLVC